MRGGSHDYPGHTPTYRMRLQDANTQAAICGHYMSYGGQLASLPCCGGQFYLLALSGPDLSLSQPKDNLLPL